MAGTVVVQSIFINNAIFHDQIEVLIRGVTTQSIIQRQAWTFRLGPERREEFRTVMRTMLERCEADALQRIEPWEHDEYGEDLSPAERPPTELWTFESGSWRPGQESNLRPTA